MTERLFLDDATLARTSARVLASGPDGVVLNRTVFYARSGGQPGDAGTLRWEGGGTHVADTGQIGPVQVLQVENKGRQNRRVTIALKE